MNVYSSFINICLKLETRKMSFKRWMDEYDLVFPAARLSIVNVLIYRYKHWGLHKRCVFHSILPLQIIRLALEFLYTCLSRWLVWVHPWDMDLLSLYWRQGWGTVLRPVWHHRSTFYFLQSLNLWQVPNSVSTLTVPRKQPLTWLWIKDGKISMGLVHSSFCPCRSHS